MNPIRYLKPFGASYGAFEGCESLYCVDMPDAIYEVGPRAFKNCSALNNIYFPQQKQEKADYINREMLGIQIFDIGESTLNIIGDEAFAGLTPLKTLFLPLNNVGDTAGEMCSNILTGYTGILYHILSQSREQSRYGSTISSWAGSYTYIIPNVEHMFFYLYTSSTTVSGLQIDRDYSYRP